MQIMVNKAADFCHRWQLEFNVPKCSVLEYSKQECNNTVRLRNQLIPKLNSKNNLGAFLKLPKERDIEFTESRISSARRCVSAFLAIGSTLAPVSHISAARVHNSVSLSRMLYGVEVSEVSNSVLRSLEDVHWDIGKKIQGLN